MNPEGKLHDWTDLPEEEIPELQQIATGGLNPEAARQMVENLQACKGKGKMRGRSENRQPSNKITSPSINGYATKSNQPNVQSSFGAMSASGWPAQNGKTFQSSYAEVFKNRRGIFEQGNTYEPKTYKTLDDISLPAPRVSSFSKQSNPVTKVKGSNRVQFEDDKGIDESNIANHYGKRVSESDKIHSDTKNLSHNNIKKEITMSQNTEINNPDTSHTPIWQPLSRSRTAPDLVSTSGTTLNSIREFFDNKHNIKTKKHHKVNIHSIIKWDNHYRRFKNIYHRD